MAQAPSIEMPLAQYFQSNEPSHLYYANPRDHWFGRSEDYNLLRLAWPLIVDPDARAPIQLLSLELQAIEHEGSTGPIVWQTMLRNGDGFYWQAGQATVELADLDFSAAPPAALSTLQLLLGSVLAQLVIEEAAAARQGWLGLNPWALVAHDDWMEVAARIRLDLIEVAQGKESQILGPDGAFLLPVREDLDAFILP